MKLMQYYEIKSYRSWNLRIFSKYASTPVKCKTRSMKAKKPSKNYLTIFFNQRDLLLSKIKEVAKYLR